MRDLAGNTGGKFYNMEFQNNLRSCGRNWSSLKQDKAASQSCFSILNVARTEASIIRARLELLPVLHVL